MGVTTQDPKLQRALDVPDKATRVQQFHHNTMHALAEIVAAMGMDHTNELTVDHVVRRVSQYEVRSFGEIHAPLEPGQLLEGTAPQRFQRGWDISTPEVFRPSVSYRT